MKGTVAYMELFSSFEGHVQSIQTFGTSQNEIQEGLAS